MRVESESHATAQTAASLSGRKSARRYGLGVTGVAMRGETLSIDGPTGSLEACLELPADTAPRACGIVCHPHPLHAGTMANKVVYTLARSLVGLGIAALRFNFRGVGASEGVYDDGRGEVDDALAAAALLRGRWPSESLVIAGFSFGAAVAVRAARVLDPLALVTVAPPVERLDPDEPLPRCPWLVVHGDNDRLIDLDAVVAWLDGRAPGAALDVIEGADHFFHRKLGEIRVAVDGFIAPLLGGEPGAVDRVSSRRPA